MKRLRGCAAVGGSGRSTIMYHRTHQLTMYRVPTIAWQFLWNYAFGPYLLWKIRLIRDIYNWRLQTTLAVVAG